VSRQASRDRVIHDGRQISVSQTRLIRGIQRAEYFWRPSQTWRRFRRKSLLARNEVKLAWGLPVAIDPSGYVGVDILNLGVYDRVVPEAICRLLDPGDLAFDVGANIGQNVSIMALVLGEQGRAIAFEPGQESWRLLTENVAAWEQYQLSPITVVRQAVSSRRGTGWLFESVDLGSFTLEKNAHGAPHVAAKTGSGISVDLTTLDEFTPPGTSIGLIKIDVEGHELSVLEGAARLLHEQCVRDIIFEDFQPQPSPVTMRLQAAGYIVFSLFTAWRKPALLSFEQLAARQSEEFPQVNFLATCEPARARKRFEGAGWKCLRLRARLRQGGG
jgi:FkbM family methyltransferase